MLRCSGAPCFVFGAVLSSIMQMTPAHYSEIGSFYRYDGFTQTTRFYVCKIYEDMCNKKERLRFVGVDEKKVTVHWEGVELWLIGRG